MVQGDGDNCAAAGDGPGALPEPLEARLYAACFEAADAAAAVAALIAAEPQHAAALQQLADKVRGVQLDLRCLDPGPADGGGETTLGLGTRLGSFVVDGEIGRGAFGVVYRGSQLAPVQRPVAIKVLTWSRGAPEVMRRFAVERDLLARLDHPGVTRVFDAGVTAQGQPYFVMELVVGTALTDFADRERLSLAQRLRLFVQLCEVVQHAHQIGVVHRDLKPGNVLVRRREQSFEVKVIDFGLAKLTADGLSPTAVSTTEIGRLMGTPEYMSPEQARGQAVDTRTDVHALGVLLFQLLTGALPFPSERLRAQGLASVVKVLEFETAPPPSRAVTAAAAAACGTAVAQLRAALRGDLDLVVATCLHKERDRRYGTVAELAADVMRHLDHQPLSVRAPRLGYVLGKLLRRHRLAGAAALMAAASLLATALVLAWSFVRVDTARNDAEHQAYAATIAAARAALASERAAEAAALLRDSDPGRRGLEYELLAVALEDARRVVTTGVGFVGGCVAVGDTALVIDRGRPALVAVAMDRDQVVERVELEREPRAIAVDRTGTVLAIVESGGVVQLYDARTRQRTRRLQLPGEANDRIEFTGDGEFLLLAAGRELWVVEVATGELRHRCRHRDNLWDIAVDPRRLRVAASDHSGDVVLWDPIDGTELDRLQMAEVPQHLCFHPRQDVLFVADDRCTIRRYQLRQGTSTAAQRVPGARVLDLGCAADGTTLVSCHDDGSVRAWSDDQLLERGVFRGHSGFVRSVVARDDGGWCTVGFDRTLRVWGRAVPERALALPPLPGTPLRAVFAQDRPVLYVATLGGAVGAHDLEQRRLLWWIASGRPRCHGIATLDDRRLWVSSGERLLALAAQDGSIEATSEPLPGRELRDVRVRLRERELVIAGSDRSLLRCDAGTGAVIATVPPPPDTTGDVYELVLHHADRLAVICGPAFGVACCDLQQGTWNWRRPEPCVALAADAQRGSVLLLLADGRLLEVEPAGGGLRRELWRGDGLGSGGRDVGRRFAHPGQRQSHARAADRVGSRSAGAAERPLRAVEPVRRCGPRPAGHRRRALPCPCRTAAVAVARVSLELTSGESAAGRGGRTIRPRRGPRGRGRDGRAPRPTSPWRDRAACAPHPGCGRSVRRGRWSTGRRTASASPPRGAPGSSPATPLRPAPRARRRQPRHSERAGDRR